MREAACVGGRAGGPQETSKGGKQKRPQAPLAHAPHALPRRAAGKWCVVSLLVRGDGLTGVGEQPRLRAPVPFRANLPPAAHVPARQLQLLSHLQPPCDCAMLHLSHVLAPARGGAGGGCSATAQGAVVGGQRPVHPAAPLTRVCGVEAVAVGVALAAALAEGDVALVAGAQQGAPPAVGRVVWGKGVARRGSNRAAGGGGAHRPRCRCSCCCAEDAVREVACAGGWAGGPQDTSKGGK